MNADGSGTRGPTEGERRHSVRVNILGEDYVVRTEASAEHTRRVADHVDRTIRDVLSAGPVVETHKAAILAALQITDELYRARDEAERMTAAMQDLGAEVKRWLPPAKRTDAGG